MNILDKIIAHKKKEVAERRSLYPIKLLEKAPGFTAPVVSLKKYLKRPDKSGIIAEIKRKSPSKGFINKYISVEKVSIGYMQSGASALSVLTDKEFFGGDDSDLITARKFNYCPILRKDFIVDEYQITEARSLGADAVLLIAAALTPDEIKRFADLARSLQMEVLYEVHNREELDKLCTRVDIIGVNNRDLRNFETGVELSLALIKHIPKDQIRISESGIDSPETAALLRKEGFDGFLIGESFMRCASPEKACGEFIKKFKALLHEN